MNNFQVKALRERLGLSQTEFGEAIGLADAKRMVHAWEIGERKGEPYGPSGSALAAMRYLLCILEVLQQPVLNETRERLIEALPDFLKDRV